VMSTETGNVSPHRIHGLENASNATASERASACASASARLTVTFIFAIDLQMTSIGNSLASAIPDSPTVTPQHNNIFFIIAHLPVQVSLAIVP